MAEGTGDVGVLTDRLEALMRELIVCYEQLETIGAMRHEAMRTADTDRLGACIRQENELVQRIAGVEKERIEVVGRLTEEVGAPGEGAATMRWLAGRVPEAAGGRLRSLADRLREVIGAVGRQNRVSRETAERLVCHMSGLIQTVAWRLNHAKTYGRSGVMSAGPSVVSALDVTS